MASEQPIKRRVRFSDEFEPPSAPLRSTAPLRHGLTQRRSGVTTTPILRAPPSREGTSKPPRSTPPILRKPSNTNGVRQTSAPKPLQRSDITATKSPSPKPQLAQSAPPPKDRASPQNHVTPLRSNLRHSPITPIITERQIGAQPGSMMYRTPEELSLRPKLPKPNPNSGYYPFSARDITPWKRMPRFHSNGSPVTPAEPESEPQEPTRRTISAPISPPRSSITDSPPTTASPEERRSSYPTYDDRIYEVEKEMDEEPSLRRLPLLMCVVCSFLFCALAMAVAPARPQSKSYQRFCAIYEAHQFYEGWSVMVRSLESVPTSMWLDNTSPHVAKLRDGCATYNACGRTLFPCIETSSGTMHAIDRVTNMNESKSFMECVASCFKRIIDGLFYIVESIGGVAFVFGGYLVNIGLSCVGYFMLLFAPYWVYIVAFFGPALGVLSVKGAVILVETLFRP